MHTEPLHDVYNLLTNRQREVLELTSAGLTNQEIAAILCVQPSVVAEHLTNIFGHLAPVVSRYPNRYTVIRCYTLFFYKNPGLCGYADVTLTL
ncbi:MAG: helix-turn-helix transcriptional regulator [Chloroflexota bacterium]